MNKLQKIRENQLKAAYVQQLPRKSNNKNVGVAVRISQIYTSVYCKGEK